MDERTELITWAIAFVDIFSGLKILRFCIFLSGLHEDMETT